MDLRKDRILFPPTKTLFYPPPSSIVAQKKDTEPYAARGNLKRENTIENLVFKPSKWAEYESHYRSSVELVPNALRFPTDDINVEIWPKPLRVVWNMAPSPFGFGIDAATRYTLSVLFSEYTTVTHRYKNFRIWRQTAHGNLWTTLADDKGSSSSVNRTSGNKSESFFLFNNSTDTSASPPQSPVITSATVTNSSATYNRETMDESEVRRASDSDNVRNLSGDIHVKPFPQFSTLDLLIESIECKMSLEVEPLFCTLALYDVEKQIKISENFHFVLHSELLPEQMKWACDMFPRRCIFNTPVHGRIYYVIRTCNLFRGVSGKDSSSIYLKAKSHKKMEAYKKDLREKLLQFSTLLGNPLLHIPKQHLAWGAFPVFDKGPSGWNVRGEGYPLECNTFFLFETNQTDADICNILSSEKKMQNKIMFGTLSMKVRPVLGELSRYADVIISPSGIPVIPCSKLDTTEKCQYVRELEQFIPTATPNSEFVNNMYIYPEFVHLRSKPNLQLSVQIAESIERYPWPLLRAAYPPGGVIDFDINHDVHARTPKLELGDVSAINYKYDSSCFYDEFKLKVPLNLKNHHLLFTLYHINPNSKKNFKNVIGYAAIPLLKDNKILRDGTYTLIISPQAKNIDTVPRTTEESLGKQSYIRFRTRLVSTVFTQDDILSSLFENASRNSFSIVTYESIRSLSRADKVECVRFFPVIATHIFRVMCNNHNMLEGSVPLRYESQIFSEVRKIHKGEDKDDSNTCTEGETKVNIKTLKAADFGITYCEFAKEAFCSLVTLLLVVNETSSKLMDKSDETNPILAHYVRFMVSDTQVYGPLTHYWKLALTEKHASVQGFKLNWVFFSIITKSMALHLHHNGLFVEDFNRASRFHSNFCHNLRELVPFFVPQRGYDTITEFPIFVNDLFPLLDRGVILDMVHTYITTIDKNEDIFRVTAVFSFLNILSDYEHFLPLNIPVATDSVDSVIALPAKFCGHFLIEVLLSEVDNCFKKPVEARNQALSTLKTLIEKHEIDPRYQDMKTKQHIACMYFPFVLMVIDQIDMLVEFEKSEKTDIYRVLVWIVSNLSPSLLRSWFSRETKRRQGFLSILETSIHLLGPTFGDAIRNTIKYVIGSADDLTNPTPQLDARAIIKKEINKGQLYLFFSPSTIFLHI